MKRVVVEEEVTSEEDDGVILPAKLVDDSSEYSDEDFLDNEVLHTTGPYPFMEKEPEVRELAYVIFFLII